MQGWWHTHSRRVAYIQGFAGVQAVSVGPRSGREQVGLFVPWQLCGSIHGVAAWQGPTQPPTLLSCPPTWLVQALAPRRSTNTGGTSFSTGLVNTGDSLRVLNTCVDGGVRWGWALVQQPVCVGLACVVDGTGRMSAHPCQGTARFGTWASAHPG